MQTAEYQKMAHTVDSTLNAFKTDHPRLFDHISNVEEIHYELQESIKRYKEKVSALEKNRELLRIGIIGQMKVGKSSFINALLFGGKDVLPKAATPMTAALTRIYHSKTFKADVSFFSKKDWKRVEQSAKKFVEKEKAKRSLQKDGKGLIGRLKKATPSVDTTSKSWNEGKAAKEMVEAFGKSQSLLTKCLGKTERIEASDLSALQKQLAEYVGAKGRFTPIVKMTSIGLDVDDLKGFELIDTPGMNDPIISRERTTLEYLGHCDVLYVMSYTGQFLDMEDLKLFSQIIPAEGVHEIGLVGTKFDSALLQLHSGQKNRDLREMASLLLKELTEDARSKLQSAVQQGAHPTAALIRDKALPPLFVSGLLHSAAIKLENKEPLDVGEKHVLKQLRNAFPNDAAKFKDTGFLKDLSGMARFHDNLFPTLRANISNIIEERKNSVAEDVLPEWERIRTNLLSLIDEIQSSFHDKASEIKSLLVRMEESSEALTDGLDPLFESRDESLVEIFAEFEEMVDDVDHGRLQVKKETESYTTYERTWKKLWFGHEAITNYRDVDFVYPGPIIQGLEKSLKAAERLIKKRLRDTFSVDEKNTMAFEIVGVMKKAGVWDGMEGADGVKLARLTKRVVQRSIKPELKPFDIDSLVEDLEDDFGEKTEDIDDFQKQIKSAMRRAKTYLKNQVKLNKNIVLEDLKHQQDEILTGIVSELQKASQLTKLDSNAIAAIDDVLNNLGKAVTQKKLPEMGVKHV